MFSFKKLRIHITDQITAVKTSIETIKELIESSEKQ